MKKTMLFMMLTLLLSLPVAAVARAGPPTRGEIAKKQAAQHQRIQQGVQKGRLTAAEARALEQEQRRIHQLKQRFLADGRLDKTERRRLTARQKQAAARIRRLKRNRAVQPRLRARRHLCMDRSPGQASGPPV